MRDILFRGKLESNELNKNECYLSGKWVCGYYWTNEVGNHFIRVPCDEKGFYGTNDYEVLLETVGQFTGLTDKNGTKIFEGDIVKMHQFLFNGNEIENEIKGEISYGCNDDKQYPMASYCLTNIDQKDIQGHMGYQDEDVNFKELHIPIYHFSGLHEESFEVIGNIHEKGK